MKVAYRNTANTVLIFSVNQTLISYRIVSDCRKFLAIHPKKPVKSSVSADEDGPVFFDDSGSSENYSHAGSSPVIRI